MQAYIDAVNKQLQELSKLTIIAIFILVSIVVILAYSQYKSTVKIKEFEQRLILVEKR